MRRSTSVPSCIPVKGSADDESFGRSGERPPRGAFRPLAHRMGDSFRKIGVTWGQSKGYANFASLQINARDARYYRSVQIMVHPHPGSPMSPGIGAGAVHKTASNPFKDGVGAA